MPRGLRVCTACNSQNHMKRTYCEQCGATFKPGRSSGTTEAAGYSVGHNGGRTQGTTKSKGHKVSGGRPHGKKRVVDFDESIDLPTDWCHEQRFVNIDSVLLNVVTGLLSSVPMIGSHWELACVTGVGTCCGLPLTVPTPSL